MSRSRKKRNITGTTTAHTEAYDKKEWHSRFRSKAKARLRAAEAKQELDGYIDIVEYDVSNKWQMAKDGKTYWGDDPKHQHLRRK